MIGSLPVLDDERIQRKIDRVHEFARGKKVLVAFSGGVDSSVLASLVSDVALETALVMQVGMSVGIGEKEYAQKQAKQLGLPLQFLEYDEYIESEEYRNNPENRCYFCKNLLHSKLDDLREEMGFDVVVNGTNYSDLKGHRPGYQAIRENYAGTPLVDAELTKIEVRWIAGRRGLLSADKPATPCVASRVQTGIKITRDVLDTVRRGEAAIRREYGFKVFRLRYREEGLVLELGEDEIKEISGDLPQELSRLLLQEGISRPLSPIIEVYRPSVPTTS